MLEAADDSDGLWRRLRAGARNVAGVTYQVAVSADLLVAGRAARPGHPAVTAVVPEGWEDADCVVADGKACRAQMKEHGVGSAPLGIAALADVVAHAAPGMLRTGRLDDAGTIALLTDADLASGLVFSGWSASVADQPEVLPVLEVALAARLANVGIDSELAMGLLGRTHLVHRPWGVSVETQRDLAAAYGLEPVVASLVYGVLVGQLNAVASAQRTTPAAAPGMITVTGLDRIVADVTAAVDVTSLEEAIRAGVCEPVDYLHPSDLTETEFLAGVDVEPGHIAADLDVVRREELQMVLDGLSERRNVLIAGPSGSGKSALLWRSGQIVSRGARTLRVLRVASDDDVELFVRHVRRGQPSAVAPIAVCADDVGRPEMTLWPRVLRRLIEMSGVFVLSTVRREDYSPALSAGGVVGDSRLAPSSAEAIHRAIVGAGIHTSLEVEEAVIAADGLLMEFLALITTGQRLNEVLSGQVRSLTAPSRALQRRALRVVCAAHTLGFPIDAPTLGGHLSVDGDVAIVGDALHALEGEHLVCHDVTMGVWRGLHVLRSDVIQRLLHQSSPPTLLATFCEVIALLPRSNQAWALCRAAEHLARRLGDELAVSGHAPSLDQLINLLRPLAKTAHTLLAAAGVGEETARYATGILDAGERLDTIAYAHAVVPLVEEEKPQGADTSFLAMFVYSIRNDGFRLPDFAAGPAINAFADALPARRSDLSELVSAALSDVNLVELAAGSRPEIAVPLLEAAEGLIALRKDQAATIWEGLTGHLAHPPGSGFDVVAADRRAQLAACLCELADLKGSAVAPVLGDVMDRAVDTVASDPSGLTVTIRIEAIDPEEAATDPDIARARTWTRGEMLVAEATVSAWRSDPLASAYPARPGAEPGLEEYIVMTCRRILDYCPEVDRADVHAVDHAGQVVSVHDFEIGTKRIRSGVLGVPLRVRRNVAFQAAVATMRAAQSWSSRLRAQAELARELVVSLGDLPLRLRGLDNARRRREWMAAVRSVEQRVSALPGRPPDPDSRAGSPGTLSAADETARAVDLEKAALEALIGPVAQAAAALESSNPAAMRGAGMQLRDALAKLAKARAAGAPYLAAVGDTLPPELDGLAIQVGTVLFATAKDDETRRKVARAGTLAEIDSIVAFAAQRQAASDRGVLGARLEASHIDGVAYTDIPDPAPLAGRLDRNETLALVPWANWVDAYEALTSWSPDDRQGVAGRLVAVAVYGDYLLPIGYTFTGSVGSGFPMVDLDEFGRIARVAGLSLLDGPCVTMIREATADLVAWSAAMARRSQRTPSWAQSPLPVRTPADVIAHLDGQDYDNSFSRQAVDAVRELVKLVSDEDGSAPGFAAHFDRTSGADPDAIETTLAASAALLALAAQEQRTAGSGRQNSA